MKNPLEEQFGNILAALLVQAKCTKAVLTPADYEAAATSERGYLIVENDERGTVIELVTFEEMEARQAAMAARGVGVFRG